MKKTLIATALISLTCSSFALAHSDDCNIEFNGKLQLSHQVLTVTPKGGAEVTITPDYQLLLDGEEQSVSASNQQWVEQYYNGINQAVPQTLEIATDGLKLASVAVEEVLGELIGHDDDTVIELVNKLENMSTEVAYQFYAEDGSIRVDSEQWQDGAMFEQQWQAEFEQVIEEVVLNSMGKLMIAVGKEMIWHGGDMEAFEQRMGSFASDIEHNLEAKAKELEGKAMALCTTLAKVDIAEARLQQLPGFQNLNVVEVSNHKNAM